MDHEDRAAVEAVKAGNTEEFRHLVDRHKDRLFAVIMRLVGDEALAGDLVQDTFVKAFHGLDGFRMDASVGTWLVQIAIHTTRDHIRRMGRRYQRNLVSLEEVRAIDGLTGAATTGDSDPSRGVEAREESDLLQLALADLPLEYRELIVLRHLEDVPYEEIAEMTGLSVGTLKVRAYRARRLLRERLIAHGWDDTGAGNQRGSRNAKSP